MKYIYQAKKGPEQTVEGEIEAPNQDAAVRSLVQAGLVPVSVETESEHLARKSPGQAKSGRRSLLPGKRVSKRHIYLFTKQMKSLIKSHVPILNSLYIIEGQATNIHLKAAVESIIRSVREGASFSESLEKFPQYFPPLYISMIRAGEAGGRLDHSFEQISAYMERETQLEAKVRSSLAYPLVMVSVGIVTLIFLLTFVVPKLGALFEDMSEGLPLVTRVLLGVSGFCSRYWVFLSAAAAAAGVFLYYTRGAKWQVKALSAVKKRLPVVKDVIYNQSLSRFSSGLAMLLTSGVSIADSIRIAMPLAGDEEAQRQLAAAHRQIISGTGLEESFKANCTFLPEIFIKMIAVGESSGKLDEILGDLARDYADAVEAETKVIMSLVEPVAILVVGSILGLIVVAILLPIFEMSFVVQ